jgi:hypothetical protein
MKYIIGLKMNFWLSWNQSHFHSLISSFSDFFFSVDQQSVTLLDTNSITFLISFFLYPFQVTPNPPL